MEWSVCVALIFWSSLALIIYAYLGYPLILLILRPLLYRPVSKGVCKPGIDMIIPAYNEERVIAAKIRNSLALDYPREKLNIIVISDASMDATDDIIQGFTEEGVSYLRQEKRRGKAAALNRGLAHAEKDIVVFTDASILLARNALQQIARPFHEPQIGCVSGEDHIQEGGGGEGLYGRYELFLRNLESKVNSVVGASGCFYAQRRSLCHPFIEGMAPDFLSVLATVESGYRAVTCPPAVGYMSTVSIPQDEYSRKVRTFIRGITTLLYFKKMLNPFKYGFFAVELISHKLMRWFSGLFLIGLFLSNLLLLNKPLYGVFFLLQFVFYITAIIGWIKPEMLNRIRALKIPFYFCLVNAAALSAWVRYFRGIRQEIWEPSKR
jgi:cellulose synthase/poly-beta-1,6-N-acetylglucosamine synthase-like glycosyltransferase